MRSAIGLALGLVSGALYANGYAVNDKSVSSLGSAYAGAAALGEDASALYNNPALLTELMGTQLSLGGHYVKINSDYRDQGSTTSGAPTTAVSESALLPNLYYVSELSPTLRLGAGVYAPFGMGVEYDPNWHGRYHSIKSDLRTLNISPTVAWKFAPHSSLGVSLDVAYADAALTQAVDFGTICYAQLGAATCNSLGLTPQGSDGLQHLTGDSWSYGLSLGGATSFNEGQTRLGIVWHGPVHHTLKGSSTFDKVPAPFATVFTHSGAEVEITLPESVSISLAQSAGERLMLLADYTWTRWSRFEELRVSFDNALPDAASRQEWQNAARYSVGVRYQLAPQWWFRTGYARDVTPVPSAERRSPRTPDLDRNWYTLGVKWQMQTTLSIDASYAYMRGGAALINNTDSMGHTLSGSYDPVITHYLSLQGNMLF